MTDPDLQHAQGRLAGMADWLRGVRGEQGEDVPDDPWHRGYVEGWNVGGPEDFKPGEGDDG